MKGRLIHLVSGDSFELKESNTLGRNRDSAVPIEDPRASRRHALIREQQDGYCYFDLGSSNGSYINNRRVTTAHLLRNGDFVKIGEAEFRFEGGQEIGKFSDESQAAQTIIGAQSKEVLILVSDIQGFTSLSERLAPDELAPIMGAWYGDVGRVLDEHGATVDKYIGDCVLAYWLSTSSPARLAALKAARAMARVAEGVQRDHRESLERAGVTFRTGAAIHLGSVAYGAVSAGEFTLLGDAVNLAFRLESLTREIGKPVLVSGDFLDSWEAGRGFCEPCGSHQVKGRSESVDVFSVERAPE